MLEKYLTRQARRFFKKDRLSQKSWWYLLLLANEGKL